MITEAAKRMVTDTQKWKVAGFFMRTLQIKYRRTIVRSVLKVFEPYLRFVD